MTWPGWGDVLPLLTTLVTTLVTVIGAVVTWARISDRTVSRAVEKAGRQSEKAAREAAAEVSAEVKALAEKLATNDFPHVEARIERGLAAARADREAMEARLGGRIERMEEAMETRLGGRIERMEVRLLAAVRRVGVANGPRRDGRTRVLGRMPTMWRLRRTAIALVLASFLFFPGTLSAQEPESEDARVTIMGVVYDVVTGTAIPTAAVSLENGRQGVLTDDQGVFRLEDVEAGPQLLVVTQFGYQKRAIAATVTPESSGMMQVALTPRPIMLAGVTATVENVMEMEARLRFRRRAAGFSTRAYDRQELFRAMSGTPLDFLNQRTMVHIVTCPPGTLASRCVRRRGRAIEPWVYVDEALAWGGLDELESYAVSDIYLMEVFSWGSEIRIYTNQFMEQMARKPMMPIPLNLWTRPAR